MMEFMHGFVFEYLRQKWKWPLLETMTSEKTEEEKT